jgi:hypothetical protein
MTQSGVRALARVTRAIALAAVVTGFGATALAAQGATGKLEGRVFDQGGQPVANAQVVIEGTAFATTANPQGYYFFNSVPAGAYNVRFAYIGYKAVRVEGVRIVSGQTITLDRTLEATNVELQEITVVGAQNALVPRDQVTSKQIIDGNFTDNLPVDRIGAVFALQPGVMASPGSTVLSVRGGRPDENSTYIDGVPVQPGNRGTGGGRSLPTLQVGTNAFEDASITTGATSAEFGNAQGGVIAITTRTGGQSFSGNIGYETDEFSGLRNSSAFNRIQASIGGPITKSLTFFVGGVLEGTRSGNNGYRGWEIPGSVNSRLGGYVPVGVDTVYTIARTTSATSDSIRLPVYNYALLGGDCDAYYVANAADPDIRNNYGEDCLQNRVPYSPASSAQLTSKLNYSFGQGSRIALSFIGSRGLSRGQRGTDATGGTTNTNNVAILNWNQVLSRSSSRAVALDAYLSYQWDRSINSVITPESEENTRNPFGGFLLKDFDYELGFDDFPVNDELVENFRTQRPENPITLYDRFLTQQYLGQPGFGGSIGNPGSIPTGYGAAPGTLNTAFENRLIARANLDWQLDRYNRLKIGGQYIDSELGTYNVGSSGQGFGDIYLARPVSYNLFVEDRLDLGDVVLVAGVRYDYFDVGASKWRDFPRISSNPDFDPDNVEGVLEPYTSHDYIAPSIQVAFPVTERTNFRLSYSQQVQTPDYSVILRGSNTDLSITNTNNNYGTDLDFGKTILFEFGVRHAFSDDMVLDVAVYNKDNLANAAGRLIPVLDPRSNARTDLRLTTNQDFGNTRGLDMRLDRRIGNIFNGVISYSYQDARSTGSDPYTYINFGSRITSAVTGNASPPPQAAQPVGFSRPHNLAAQFAFNFPADFQRGSIVGKIMSRMNITGTARYASGTPYTRCNPSLDDDLAVTSGGTCNNLGSDFNSSRRPAFKNVDLRVTKGFRMGGLDLTAYADARNVFNIENVLNVFAQTGNTDNARYRDLLWQNDSASFAINGTANGVRLANGSLDLPKSDAECGAWRTTGANPSPPTCYFFRKGEQRHGNGDGIYTVEEQRRASDLQQAPLFHISRWAGTGRRVRLGMEVNF